MHSIPSTHDTLEPALKHFIIDRLLPLPKLRTIKGWTLQSTSRGGRRLLKVGRTPPGMERQGCIWSTLTANLRHFE